ncbi:hypothetical protein, partial [Undibacterium sp. 10I3]
SSAAVQARALLLHAVVCARYSSAAHFGSHDDSVLSLRRLALGLLNSAVLLDPAVLPVEQRNLPRDRIDSWRNALAGVSGTFTCSAII